MIDKVGQWGRLEPQRLPQGSTRPRFPRHQSYGTICRLLTEKGIADKYQFQLWTKKELYVHDCR